MISIVMTYFNRLPLLRHTLSTIKLSKKRDVEIIIVDDFSSEQHSLNQIQKEFSSLDIHIINMRDIAITKDYYNPCIPFNVGFRHAKGDIIVIQNPECCHMGDVLDYVSTHLTDENYLSFHCFASTRDQIEALHSNNSIVIPEKQELGPRGGCWYVHEQHRPFAWHFTSAITRSNLKQLNGFDERFAQGRGGDDVEFLYRVQHLGLNIKFVSEPFVIHQWHSKDPNTSYDTSTSMVVNAELSYQTKISSLIKAPNKQELYPQPQREKNMNYSIYLISNKPEVYQEIKDSISPEVIHYFDGTDYPSFSKLVNDCVANCPTETIIIASSKVRPTQDQVHKLLDLLDQGYGFVGLYLFGFFGFRKELFRKIGPFDERFIGGGHEDWDFLFRLREANIPVYISQEVTYFKSASSWNYSLARPHMVKKWHEGLGNGCLSRAFAEEEYSYDWGPSTNEIYIKIEKSVFRCDSTVRCPGPYFKMPVVPYDKLHEHKANIPVGKILTTVQQFTDVGQFRDTGSQILNFSKSTETKSYLELGVYDNANFNSIKAREKFSVDKNGKAMFTGTTDEFFNQHNPNKKYDIVYIDANHDYEYVLRDFNNSVTIANEWIVMHDCVPPTESLAASSACSDSYRVLYYLLKETNFEVYVMNTNFGLTFVKMPAQKINPSIEFSKTSYLEFTEFLKNTKVYTPEEIVEILN